MKKYVIIIILTLSIFGILSEIKNVYGASKGEVSNYEITISENKDASINMTYNITLNVENESIDSVKIKLPHGVKKVISKDSNINSIEISSNGKIATVNFNRIYNVGSNVKFSFALRNSNVYEYNSKKDLVKYRISIGDVKEFKNNNITVKWNASSVYFQGMGTKQGNFYVWNQEYSIIRNFQVVIQYKGATFDLIEGGEKQNQISDYIIRYGLIAIAAIIIIIELFVNDSYKKNRGFSLSY